MILGDLGGSGRIWGGRDRILGDLGGFERILDDLDGSGRVWGVWMIWEDLV